MKKIYILYISVLTLMVMKVHAEHGISFETKETDLDVFDQSHSHLYRIPNIHTYSNLEIRLPGVNKKEVEKKNTEAKNEAGPQKPAEEKSISSEEKSKLSSLIIQANEMYYRGNFGGALILINQAETIDANNVQVKTMKGSLLIETKHVQEGLKYWKDSLKLNPNQPDLEKKVKEMEGGTK